MLRKFNKTICFVIAVLLVFAGCVSRTGDSAPGKNKADTSEVQDSAQKTETYKNPTGKYTSRSFYMGFTPFPYASTPEATN